MVICEERAIERILSLGFCDTAIPVTVRQELGKEAQICVLPSLKKSALKFEKLFSNDYFSPAAHSWLRENVRPFMHTIGYHDNKLSRKVMSIMSRGTSFGETPNSGAVILKEPIKNLTTTDIPTLLEFGHIISAVVIDGAVVCTAYTDLAPDGEAVEVGVETAPAYRRRGYAKDALYGLINELYSLGIQPIYICSRSNIASLKLANACGFKPEALEYNYVFRRD
ncbi:MAG: GNAT family N-acetyltransferase [Clostridia bacterium]|nr:GNAT family N-acetyltransferase [Clostridia bacterium]